MAAVTQEVLPKLRFFLNKHMFFPEQTIVQELRFPEHTTLWCVLHVFGFPFSGANAWCSWTKYCSGIAFPWTCNFVVCFACFWFSLFLNKHMLFLKKLLFGNCVSLNMQLCGVFCMFLFFSFSWTNFFVPEQTQFFLNGRYRQLSRHHLRLLGLKSKLSILSKSHRSKGGTNKCSTNKCCAGQGNANKDSTTKR